MAEYTFTLADSIDGKVTVKISTVSAMHDTRTPAGEVAQEIVDLIKSLVAEEKERKEKHHG